MNKIIKIFLALMVLIGAMCAENPGEGDIIAYPVPFNPGRSVLTIGYRDMPAAQIFYDKVVIDIYDSNGEDVFSWTGAYDSGGPTPNNKNIFIWNGRNSSGDAASAGEYTIKITIDNTQTGYHDSLIIPILIQR
jgi:hypothetical protein